MAAPVEPMQAPTVEPTLPVALAPLVAYIGGLTVVPAAHLFAHVEVRTATSSAAAGSASVHPNLTASSSNHFVTPLDFNRDLRRAHDANAPARR